MLLPPPAVVCVVLGACLAGLSAFVANPAAASSPKQWRLAYGIGLLAAAGPLIAAGILWVGGHVKVLSLGDSRSAGAKGTLIALVVSVAVIGGAYLLASRRRRWAGSALAAALTLCLLAGIAPEVDRAKKESNGGASQFALLGAQLAQVTTPDAVIAVQGAGASQYFSHRPMVDVLGKSDKHIAKGPAATDAFLPGHNKWNVAYSVGKLQPDVVAQIPYAPDAELRRFGYSPMRLRQGRFAGTIEYANESVVYVRRDSPNVRFNFLVPVESLP